MTETLFDAAASRQSRDEGIAKVVGHNAVWTEHFNVFVSALPRGWHGSGEDLRRLYTGPQPKHHNAWGGAISGLVRNGVLAKTGRHVQMRDERSHARSTAEYMRTKV